MKKLLCVLMFGMVFGQTKLETRLYDYDVSWNIGQQEKVDLSVITNGELTNSNYAIIDLIGIDISSISERVNVRTGGDMQGANGDPFFEYDLDEQYGHGFTLWGDRTIYSSERDRYFYVDFGAGGTQFLVATLKLAITSELEDTGDTNGDGYDDVCYEAGADSGDVNGDGELNVLDMVIYAYEIING